MRQCELFVWQCEQLLCYIAIIAVVVTVKEWKNAGAIGLFTPSTKMQMAA